MNRSRKTISLLFRDFLVADMPELVDLWVESWTEVYPAIDFNDRRSWFADHLVQWQQQGGLCQVALCKVALCKVAHDSPTGTMAGFVLLKTDTGHLDQFCVSVASKGSGVAQSLMVKAKSLSPLGLHLDVNAMNHRAIRFYEREGFEKTGEGVNLKSGLPILFYRWQP